MKDDYIDAGVEPMLLRNGEPVPVPAELRLAWPAPDIWLAHRQRSFSRT